MDNQTAKHILSVYRPNGQDADDPRIRQALEHCLADPEMRLWLEEQTRFDRNVAQALQTLHAPTEGRREILAAASFASAKPNRRRALARWPIWFAAALLALMAAYFATLPFTSSGPGNADTAPDLATLASQALPLDLHSDELAEIQAWLRSKGSPSPKTLPPQLSAAAGAAGCRVLGGELHAPVSLICFRLGGDLVHLFIFEKSHPLAPKDQLDQWSRQGDWHVYGWTDDRFAFALATRNDSASLRRQLGQVSWTNPLPDGIRPFRGIAARPNRLNDRGGPTTVIATATSKLLRQRSTSSPWEHQLERLEHHAPLTKYFAPVRHNMINTNQFSSRYA